MTSIAFQTPAALARSTEMFRRARNLGLGLIVFVLTAGGCVSSSTTAPGAQAPRDNIDAYVAEQMRVQHIPGLTLAVVRNGETVKLQGYGVSNLELNTPADASSVYKIGSVSKQFIAAGIVLLSQEGRLNLDDPITNYLQGAPASWRPITIRQVLTHSGGIIREAPGFDPLKVQSEADLIRTAYAQPLAFEPGTNWAYSNLGYFILGEIISKASNMPWPRYLQERVFVPLGMSATRTTTNEALVPDRADGYEWADGTFRNADILIAVRPSGALISSAVDLIKWDAALTSGRLFTPEQLAMIQTPVRLSDGSQRPYGFGWQVEQVGGHRVVFHSGTIPGFRTNISRFVDDRLTVIVLTNLGTSLPDRIAVGVAAQYIADLLPARRPTTVAAAVLETYLGDYRLNDGRIVRVTLEQGKLRLTMLAQGRTLPLGELTAESNTRFYLEADPRTTYVFATDAPGPRLMSENQNGQVGLTALRVDGAH